MGKRGRPHASRIRQQMIDILSVLGEGYGYEIHKLHKKLYVPCTREVVYYHLKKGVALAEIKVTKVVKEEGSYSWGPDVQKTYYGVGPEGKPEPDQHVKDVVLAYIAEKMQKQQKQQK